MTDGSNGSESTQNDGIDKKKKAMWKQLSSVEKYKWADNNVVSENDSKVEPTYLSSSFRRDVALCQ